MGNCPIWGYSHAYWEEKAKSGQEQLRIAAKRSHTDYVAALSKLRQLKESGADVISLKQQAGVAQRCKSAAMLDAEMANSFEDLAHTSDRIKHTELMSTALAHLSKSVDELKANKGVQGKVMDRLREMDEVAKERVSEIKAELADMVPDRTEDIDQDDLASTIDDLLKDQPQEEKFALGQGAGQSVRRDFLEDSGLTSNEDLDLVAELESLVLPSRDGIGKKEKRPHSPDEDDVSSQSGDGPESDALLAQQEKKPVYLMV